MNFQVLETRLLFGGHFDDSFEHSGVVRLGGEVIGVDALRGDGLALQMRSLQYDESQGVTTATVDAYKVTAKGRVIATPLISSKTDPILGSPLIALKGGSFVNQRGILFTATGERIELAESGGAIPRQDGSFVIVDSEGVQAFNSRGKPLGSPVFVDPEYLYNPSDLIVRYAGFRGMDAEGRIYFASYDGTWRLNADGTADTSFGDQGFVSFGDDCEGLLDWNLLSDGSIRAVIVKQYDFAVKDTGVGFTSSGQVDSRVGSGSGRVVLDGWQHSIRFGPEGDVYRIAPADPWNLGGSTTVQVRHYDADFNLDRSYGYAGNGIAGVSIPASKLGNGVDQMRWVDACVDSTGGLVLALSVESSNDSASKYSLLVRLTAPGEDPLATVTAVNGTLNIVGSEADDRMVVGPDMTEEFWQVFHAVSGDLRSATCFEVAIDEVASIQADLGTGDDLLSLDTELPSTIYLGEGSDEFYGGSGPDAVFGGEGIDHIEGRRGADALYGDGGADNLSGGSGNDVLRGNAGDDYLFGGGGRDRLYGGTGTDELFGQSGSDRLDGGEGTDYLTGGSAKDYLFGGTAVDYRTEEDRNDVLNSIEAIGRRYG